MHKLRLLNRMLTMISVIVLTSRVMIAVILGRFVKAGYRKKRMKTMIRQPHKIVLVALQEKEYQTIPKLFSLHPVERGWNVLHVNRHFPDKIFCMGYETETKAINAFNVTTKLTGTMLAVLRFKQEERNRFVWML